MRVLAIDTSSNVATVAVMEDELLLGEYILNHKKTHSQRIMTMIEQILSELELNVQDIDIFAAAIGPGSFTGLRIGVATVKALAHATGKPVILLLVDGRVATINWAERYIPGIVHAWFPGEFMGDAVAQVLFGDYNPGGKLAVTFPRSVGQIPFAFPFKPGSDSKGFVRVTGTLYPFGYGLSYTTFAYSDLKIENPVIGVQGSVKLSCKVKNTGKVAGDEVVQLYLHDEMSSVTTYVKVLRGFERIHLEPGEEKVIDFVLTPQELGLWNKDNHFVVEPGTFAVMVGSSSQDIKLQGKFEVK